MLQRYNISGKEILNVLMSEPNDKLDCVVDVVKFIFVCFVMKKSIHGNKVIRSKKYAAHQEVAQNH